MYPGKMTFKKYFLAIVTPEPILGKIEALKQELSAAHGLKGALRSPAHITLHRPFEWKLAKENQLLEGLTKFKYLDPFHIHLSGFDFFEPRVVFVRVMPNEHLNALHYSLSRYAQENFRLFNETGDRRGFHPHVTVAFRDLKKPLFYELQGLFTNQPFDAEFRCDTFSLLRLEKRWEVIHTFSF